MTKNKTEQAIRSANKARPVGPYHCCSTDADGETVAEWWEDTLTLAGTACAAAVKGAGNACSATAEDARGNVVIVRRRRK